jgi:hypothetical protein
MAGSSIVVTQKYVNFVTAVFPCLYSGAHTLIHRHACWRTCIIGVRFEVFAAVTMKNVVFWDVTPCASCKNRRFGGMYGLHLQGENNQRAKTR